PLPRDTRAILRRKTLLGEAYIELTPGNRQVGAPMIAEGGQIPDAHVGSTVEIDEVLKALNPPSRRNLQRWLAGWSDAVDRRAQNISDITGMFPRSSTTLAACSA
ncbi:MlaD family protein, partial [Conexibacter sp. W3-3-2]|uniref:MlaD family protein n=1 Tax=Conexibacter sp. W3-3-2 TaxID=2675227 RepID=UPI0035C8E187